MQDILVPVSPGELLDKITILRIKSARIGDATSIDHLESLRVGLLGKSGLVTEQLKALGKLAPDERKVAGERVNRAKESLQNAIAARRIVLEEAADVPVNLPDGFTGFDERAYGETIIRLVRWLP